MKSALRPHTNASPKATLIIDRAGLLSQCTGPVSTSASAVSKFAVVARIAGRLASPQRRRQAESARKARDVDHILPASVVEYAEVQYAGAVLSHYDWWIKTLLEARRKFLAYKLRMQHRVIKHRDQAYTAGVDLDARKASFKTQVAETRIRLADMFQEFARGDHTGEATKRPAHGIGFDAPVTGDPARAKWVQSYMTAASKALAGTTGAAQSGM